jgi:poly-gamma-glutamate synthesis protein (capsule biosynthesis protein)
VDIIHGHSAHIVQGIEAAGGKPILYDTGNFIDDYRVRPLRNDRSFIHLLDVDADTGKVEKITLVPTSLSGCQVRLAEDSVAAESCSRMERLCSELGTKTERAGAALVIPMAGSSPSRGALR